MRNWRRSLFDGDFVAEEGLYTRAKMYATDFNNMVLLESQGRHFPVDR
jgi:hypothetical protein